MIKKLFCEALYLKIFHSAEKNCKHNCCTTMNKERQNMADNICHLPAKVGGEAFSSILDIVQIILPAQIKKNFVLFLARVVSKGSD